MDVKNAKNLTAAVAVSLPLAFLMAPAALAADCEGDAPCSAWSVEAGYTADLMRNTRGGLGVGSAYLDALDLLATVDAGRVWGLDGLTIHGHLQYNNGAAFTGRWVGDNQTVSNIEGFDTLRVYELWAEWALGSEAAAGSLRFGLYDLNSEFDSIDTAGLFLNASHGIGPEFAQSGLNGPSIFPVTSLALRWRGSRGDAYWQLAALDAVPGDRNDPEESGIHLDSSEGALLVGEFGMSKGRISKLAVGAWSYTARFDSLDETDPLTGDPLQARGNAGVYALVDAQLWQGATARLDGFLRVGVARDRFNGVADYVGTGVVLASPFAARPDDQLGFSIASAGTGAALRSLGTLLGAPVERRETTLEFAWRAPIRDWLTLQPDLQFVINPGFDPTLDNAWVVGLRVELSGALER